MPHGTILWVDDEIDSQSALVRWLTLDGFQVDCAQSGSSGVEMAESNRYDAILLDLRLPDLYGLTVLRRIIAQPFTGPIVIITGAYGEPESETAAISSGAVAFIRKPVIAEELSATLFRLTDRPCNRIAAVASDGVTLGLPSHPDARVLKALVVTLDRLLTDPTLSAPDSTALCVPDSTPDMLSSAVELILNVVVHRGLSMLSFLTCSAALRETVTTSPSTPIRVVVARAQHLVMEGRRRLTISCPSLVRTVVARLEAPVGTTRRPSEQALADALYVDRAHLGRLLRQATGFGFREWRRGFKLQAAAVRCARTDDPFTQIAHSLGYHHLAQFDRDFRRTFGLTPSDVRKISRNHTSRNNALQPSSG